ncbi:carboxypeptidase-like regulatory domain-containing protein [Alistipes senegalensis]|nr:carboxypeptidase-like regulatory domain-containing protein [Alistipes senegalensis]
MPVVGANIIVDGTTIGTNSGLDGSFKLTVSPPTKRCPSCIWGTKLPNSN